MLNAQYIHEALLGQPKDQTGVSFGPGSGTVAHTFDDLRRTATGSTGRSQTPQRPSCSVQESNSGTTETTYTSTTTPTRATRRSAFVRPNWAAVCAC